MGGASLVGWHNVPGSLSRSWNLRGRPRTYSFRIRLIYISSYQFASPLVLVNRGYAVLRSYRLARIGQSAIYVDECILRRVKAERG